MRLIAWIAKIPVLGDIAVDAFFSRWIPYRRYMEREDRKRRLRARLLGLIGICSGFVYLYWLWGSLNLEVPFFSGLFLFAEVMCLVLFVMATIQVWTLRFKPPDGIPAARPYSVDLFLPCYGEGEPVIRRTLEAISRIRWHGPLNVYVLDDGGHDDVQATVESMGYHYLSRKKAGAGNKNAKAGNLNFGLAHSSGELVLALDADMMPSPEIVTVLAGYFNLPYTGFVQSKQAFWVSRDDPFYDRNEVFFDVVQTGFDAASSVISCGSGVMYRRKALESIGGFATWNLVEDYTTAYELANAGWRTYYYPYSLAIGLVPDDVRGVMHQRHQWALDTMRVFFWDNPFFKRGLNWKQRQGFALVGVSYICAGFIFPFIYIVPLLTYVTGTAVLTKPEFEFLAIRGGYLFLVVMGLQYLFNGRDCAKQFRVQVGIFPTYTRAVLRALKYPPGKKPRYKVTNQATEKKDAADNAKKKEKKKQASVTRTIFPQLAIVVLNAVLPFYAVFFETAPIALIATNTLVSGLAIWSLWPVLVASYVQREAVEEKLTPEVYGVEEPVQQEVAGAPEPVRA
jgi:cellulose synthase (UDP-forming)